MEIVYSRRFTKYEVRYCTYKYFVSLLYFNKHTHTYIMYILYKTEIFYSFYNLYYRPLEPLFITKALRSASILIFP